MTFLLGAPLLDACALAILEKENTHGYSLTQRMKEVVELSESAPYPMLRHLQQSGCLTVYDKPFQGHNRRYYVITPAGRALLAGYRKERARYQRQTEGLLLNEKGERREQDGISGGPAERADEKTPVRGAGRRAVLL